MQRIFKPVHNFFIIWIFMNSVNNCVFWLFSYDFQSWRDDTLSTYQENKHFCMNKELLLHVSFVSEKLLGNKL